MAGWRPAVYQSDTVSRSQIHREDHRGVTLTLPPNLIQSGMIRTDLDAGSSILAAGVRFGSRGYYWGIIIVRCGNTL